MSSSADSIWRKDIIGWSLYDFANTIYSMNIVSRYLKLYIVDDLGYDDRYFDIPFAISMLLAAALLPALGAMSDHATKKKLFLFLFTLTACMSIGLMALASVAGIVLLLVLFIIANLAYEAGQPFYNSLLYSVADGLRARYISGVGVALGYVGSILGMILVLPFVNGSMLFFDIPGMDGWGRSGSFIPTALLFMLFALPLFFWVREKPVVNTKKISFRQSYREVWEGLRQTKKYPGVLRFLIADYCFEDAAMTVIINIGLYCALVIGFSDDMITLFLIVSTASAVLGSFVIGKLSQRMSLNFLMRSIAIGWIICLLFFALTENIFIIWILGSVIGILLGGLWTVSRPLLAELVPREELGRFFGIFSLSGRAAAIAGPLIWTTVVYYLRPNSYLGLLLMESFDLTDTQAEKLPYRAAVLSLVGMMLLGLFLFRKVPETGRPTRADGAVNG